MTGMQPRPPSDDLETTSGHRRPATGLARLLSRAGSPPDDSPNVGRLVSFSDGVFAIAITLLAFQLRVPRIANGLSASELLNALGRDAHQFVVFGVSFAVIGNYWVVHHRAFHHMSGHDRALAYVNLVFLFTLSFLPFSANLFGQYRDNRTAVVFYGASLAAVSLSFALVWFTALRHGFITTETDPRMIRMMSWRAILAPVIFVGSTALAAFVSRQFVEYSWLAVVITLLGVNLAYADLRSRY